MKTFYSFTGVWREVGLVFTHRLKTSRDPGFYCSLHLHFPCWSSWSWDGCRSPTDQENQRSERGEHSGGGGSLLSSAKDTKAPSSLPSVPVSGHLFLQMRLGREAAGEGGTYLQRQCWPAQNPASAGQEACNWLILPGPWPSDSAPFHLF